MLSLQSLYSLAFALPTTIKKKKRSILVFSVLFLRETEILIQEGSLLKRALNKIPDITVKVAMALHFISDEIVLLFSDYFHNI